jgi:hypothetical protein
MNNLRQYNRGAIKHDHFTCYIYQCQPHSVKFLTEDWEFAVRRQGFKSLDYNEKVFSLNSLDRKHHWMLILPHNEQARQVLMNIDYNDLARQDGSSRCGFGKAQLVESYNVQLKTIQQTYT